MNIPRSYTANLHTLNKTRPLTTSFRQGQQKIFPYGSYTLSEIQSQSNSETLMLGLQHAKILREKT